MTRSTRASTAVFSDRADRRPRGYELLHRLGSGGMGELWAAVRIGAAGALKPCVIKSIRPELMDDPRSRELFAAEGRVGMLLRHANLVSVFDVGTLRARPFVAMDWVDGVSLASLQERLRASGGRPMAVVDAVHIVAELLEALRYIHGVRIAGRGAGVVHLDVSPGNVMVSAHGEVKLMDFGLAGLARAREQSTPADVWGTLRYLSREQVRGRPEPASDLFAAGAILHELLDGRRFRHACVGRNAILAEILLGGIPPLHRRIPPQVESLRRGLLEPRPELRIKTAQRALAQVVAWPGYRNRRLWLADLYRRMIGEPRSGLTRLLHRGVRVELLDELCTGATGPRRRGAPPRATPRAHERPEATVVTRAPGGKEAVVQARVVEHAAAHRAASPHRVECLPSRPCSASSRGSGIA